MEILFVFVVFLAAALKMEHGFYRNLKKSEPILISSQHDLLLWAAQNVDSLGGDHVIRANKGEIYTFDPSDDDDCSGTLTLRMNVLMPPGNTCFDVDYDTWSKERSALLMAA